MSFNVQEIVSKANAIVQQDATNLEGYRDMFVEVIFDWSDYYSETFIGEENEDSVAMVKKLVDLWVAYAHFESSLKQFKKATEVFDKAMGDPIVGKYSQLYELYAEYLVGRGKLGNAQNAFIKGLCAQLPVEESNKLWKKFLRFMHSVNKSNELTLQQLYEAIKSKPDTQYLSPIPATASMSRNVSPIMIAPGKAIADMSIVEHKEPQPALVSTSSTAIEQKSAAPSTSITTTSTVPKVNPITTNSSMPEYEFKFEVDFTSEQLLYFFNRYPPLLFVAPIKEPLLSGTANLSPSEAQELENFCNVAVNNDTINFYLDVMESLYYAQSLRERQCDQWKRELMIMQRSEETSLKSRLATLRSPQDEIFFFKQKRELQQRLLQCLIHKELWEVFVTQQRILHHMSFPHCNQAFVANIEIMMKQLRKQAIDQHTQAMTSGGNIMITQEMINGEQKYTILKESFYHEIHKQQALVNAVLHARINFIIDAPKDLLLSTSTISSTAPSVLSTRHDGSMMDPLDFSVDSFDEVLTPSSSVTSTPTADGRKRIRKRRRTLSGSLVSHSTRQI